MESRSELDIKNEDNYDRLIVSIEAGQRGLNLLIAVCDDPRYREEIIERYEKELAPEIRSYRVEVARGEPSFRAAVASIVDEDEYLQNGGEAVLTVTGAEALLFLQRGEGRSQQEVFFGYLQWTREALRRFPFTIVLWLTNQLERKLSRRAPDFWSWRKGVFRFQCHRKHAVSRVDVAGFEPFLGGEFADADDDDPHFLPVADLQELIEKIEREKGEEDRKLATLYKRLGQVYDRRVKMGEYEDYRQEQDKAIACFEKAIALQRKFDRKMDLADSLGYLAELYSFQGRYREAEPLYLEAAAIHREALPAKHPKLATHLNNLAGFYKSQGRYAEAEPLYLEAVAIDREALPAKHSKLATHLNNLAELYRSQGRYAEAEPLYLEAVAIHTEALPANHPSLATDLNNLALLYESQGRYAEGEPLYLEAVRIDREALGAKHPKLAIHLNNLAELYRSQGRYAEAEPLFLQAVAIHREALPAKHPSLATDLNNLALLYSSQGRYGEAGPLYLEALEICDRALGPEHPNTIKVRENLERFRREKTD
ncbi:MAG: tetratricopeptide repeat protein [Cyanobacteriota bacterium]|nr:tetratricopeptide repeat protein [Cyanobacteriota bacterium]